MTTILLKTSSRFCGHDTFAISVSTEIRNSAKRGQFTARKLIQHPSTKSTPGTTVSCIESLSALAPSLSNPNTDTGIRMDATQRITTPKSGSARKNVPSTPPAVSSACCFWRDLDGCQLPKSGQLQHRVRPAKKISLQDGQLLR